MTPAHHLPAGWLTRRQFGRALLAAGAVLCGRPLALLGAVQRQPDPARLKTALQARLNFATRADWTRAAPIASRLLPATPYDRITIHHEGHRVFTDRAYAQAAHNLRLIQSAHRGKGYGDIGYHYIIDPAGRLWEGRSLAYLGAHVSGQNPGNIGVMLLGNFERQRPTTEQNSALLKLVTELRRFYGIGRQRIYGHRDLDASLCPGRHLYRFLPVLKAVTNATRA